MATTTTFIDTSSALSIANTPDIQRRQLPIETRTMRYVRFRFGFRFGFGFSICERSRTYVCGREHTGNEEGGDKASGQLLIYTNADKAMEQA
jgi:hypothetical protein